MVEADEITLTLPREREFHPVVHLVLGGIAVRLDLTIETLEDLQLALTTILDRAEPGGEITVSVSLHDGALQAQVGPVDVREEFAADGNGELDLRRILSTVTDDVQVDGEWVRLTKRVNGHAS